MKTLVSMILAFLFCACATSYQPKHQDVSIPYKPDVVQDTTKKTQTIQSTSNKTCNCDSAVNAAILKIGNQTFSNMTLTGDIYDIKIRTVRDSLNDVLDENRKIKKQLAYSTEVTLNVQPHADSARGSIQTFTGYTDSDLDAATAKGWKWGAALVVVMFVAGGLILKKFL